MKIAITGHTNGLGKAIHNYYNNLGHECIGYSRTNGFDINQKFDDICNAVQSCDLFINNAHYEEIQAKFLFSLASNDLKIVSIGSESSDYYEQNKNSYSQEKLIYTLSKKKLDDIHNHLSLTSKAHMLMIKPGYMENHPKKNIRYAIKFLDIIKVIDFWTTNLSFTSVTFKNKEPA